MTLFGGECVFLEISECDISNEQTALFGGECVFLEISECDISNDQKVECHHVGVPHDPVALFGKGT